MGTPIPGLGPWLGFAGAGLNFIGNRNNSRRAARAAREAQRPWYGKEGAWDESKENILGAEEDMFTAALDQSERQAEMEFGFDERARASEYGYFDRGLGRQFGYASKIQDQAHGYDLASQDHGYELQQRGQDAHIERYQGLGLTPQELIGAPSPGGSGGGGATAPSGPSGANVVGNGPDLASAQQANTARQIEGTRAATSERIARINAAAQVESAGIAANANLIGSAAASLPAHRQASVAEQQSPSQIAQTEAMAAFYGKEFQRELKLIGQTPTQLATGIVRSVTGTSSDSVRDAVIDYLSGLKEFQDQSRGRQADLIRRFTEGTRNAWQRFKGKLGGLSDLYQ